jgi:hypothetical protein
MARADIKQRAQAAATGRLTIQGERRKARQKFWIEASSTMSSDLQEHAGRSTFQACTCSLP